MLTKRIIPCLDVRDGRVVKGLHFESIKDAGDPVQLASRYTTQGADELVFLDITASEQKRKTLKDLVSRISRVIDIPFTVGGGVNSMEDARNILLSGADKVGINTGAIKNPGLLTELMTVFGKQCVVVAIDAKKRFVAHDDIPEDHFAPNTNNYISTVSFALPFFTPKKTFFVDDITGQKFWYEVCIYGGKQPTGVDAISWSKAASRAGAGEVLLTSIDQDGTKDGYDTTLTKGIVDAVSTPVIASGGCGNTTTHILDVFRKSNVDAALAASIFHYGTTPNPIADVKDYLHHHGISVRL